MLKAATFLLAALALVSARAEDKAEADKKALQPVQLLVGEWKGAGSMKGDSKGGAWGEECDWAWDFKDGRAMLKLNSPAGKYFSSGTLLPGDKAKTFTFTGILPDGKTREEYSGELNKDGELVLLLANPGADRPARVTFSTVAKGKRLLVLLEKKRTATLFAPFAELGLTRKGSAFGKQTDERECVVTGGSGTIPVQYKGKTYYVCCTGCKQSFDANPDKEMTAYFKRKEEEKAAK